MKSFNEAYLGQKNGYTAKVGTKDWLKFMCLSFLSLIPFVGSLIHLIILIYLAVKEDTAESIKGYVRASFILWAVCFVIGLGLFILVFVWLSAAFGGADALDSILSVEESLAGF